MKERLQRLDSLYGKFCKIETAICMILFVVIVVLVFLAAVLRKINLPIQWSNDVAQLCFAWLAFLGADIALRKGSLVGVALITTKFNETVQKVLNIICYVIMIGLLIIMAKYGFLLAVRDWQRAFQTLPISYSFVTLSLAISAVLMICSIIHNVLHINELNGCSTVSCSCKSAERDMGEK
ncbi:MAG: TRAP transporter small permease [Spirochaetia bacterium]|nr:TRAP transporter small permease [Spirochaetia bacterium]